MHRDSVLLLRAGASALDDRCPPDKVRCNQAREFRRLHLVDRIQSGLVELRLHGRIGRGAGEFVAQPLQGRRWRAGGRTEADQVTRS